MAKENPASRSSHTPGWTEFFIILAIIGLLWHFTDFKDWLLERGGVGKVIRELLPF